MKKFFLLPVMLLTMILSVLTSCSDDDDKTVDVREQAVGGYTGEITVYAKDDPDTEISVIKQDFRIEKADNILSVNFIAKQGFNTPQLAAYCGRKNPLKYPA